VVLLDVPVEVAAARLAERGGALDRFEGEDGAFHERVAAGFRELAAADPERWVVVDGTGAVTEVARRVADACRARLGLG
jgi:dTMP kinase